MDFSNVRNLEYQISQTDTEFRIDFTDADTAQNVGFIKFNKESGMAFCQHMQDLVHQVVSVYAAKRDFHASVDLVTGQGEMNIL